jgi:hypothetical protein
MVIPEMTMTASALALSEPTPGPQPPDARLTPTPSVPATPTEEPTSSAASTNTPIRTPKPTNTLEPAASPSCGELYAEKVQLKGDRFEIKVRNDSSAAAYLNYSTLDWNTANAPPMRFEKFEFQGNRYYKSSSYTSPVSASAPSIALAAGRGETWKAVFKLEDQPLEGYYSATLIFDFPGWGTCTVFGELSDGP